MEQEENHSGKGTIPILNRGTPVERRHSFNCAASIIARQWHANDCRNHVGYSITFQVRFLEGWARAMAPGYSTKWRLVPTSAVTGFFTRTYRGVGRGGRNSGLSWAKQFPQLWLIRIVPTSMPSLAMNLKGPAQRCCVPPEIVATR
jgi:hypothetical protein